MIVSISGSSNDHKLSLLVLVDALLHTSIFSAFAFTRQSSSTLQMPSLHYCRNTPNKQQRFAQAKFLSPSGTDHGFDVDTTRPDSLKATSSVSSTLVQSPVFGDLRRLYLSENDEEESFLGAIGVPTFAASVSSSNIHYYEKEIDFTRDPILADKKKSRGLEGVLNHGPSFVVDNVLTKKACEQIIADCESLGFGEFKSGKNFHGAQQIVVDQSTADAIAKQLAPHIDVNEIQMLRREMLTKGKLHEKNKEKLDDVQLYIKGMNRRWRIYRYEASGEQSFAPHIDAGFPPSGVSQSGRSLVWDDSSSLMSDEDEEIVSRLTVLIYLNDDFVGGETQFFYPQNLQMDDEKNIFGTPIASVRPTTGSILLFPQGVGEDGVEYARAHWPLHEGSPVVAGRPKYVIRSDVLFATQIKKPPFKDDEVFFSS